MTPHPKTDLPNVEAPKYPHVEVRLSGEDGNGFFIIARVRQHMRRAGISNAEIDAFSSEAAAGDYDQLLRTCMRWVAVS